MTEYKRIFIDTAPFMYYLERNEQYYHKVKSLLQNWYENDAEFITSAVTIEEYCVFPYRVKRPDLIWNFERLLNDLDISVLMINKAIAKRAAELRAAYTGYKGMDALQIAAAISAKCDLFFTNDKQLRQTKEIKCVVIDDL